MFVVALAHTLWKQARFLFCFLSLSRSHFENERGSCFASCHSRAHTLRTSKVHVLLLVSLALTLWELARFMFCFLSLSRSHLENEQGSCFASCHSRAHTLRTSKVHVLLLVTLALTLWERARFMFCFLSLSRSHFENEQGSCFASCYSRAHTWERARFMFCYLSLSRLHFENEQSSCFASCRSRANTLRTS